MANKAINTSPASKINAIEIDEDKTALRIDENTKILGKIEFRNVWFRYPTRK
jgi:hypothetical protein